MRTKAYVLIAVDFETPIYHDSGLGETSNPSHPGIKFLENEKRNFIWDEVDKWIADKPEFIRVQRVSLTREAQEEEPLSGMDEDELRDAMREQEQHDEDGIGGEF